MDVAGQLDTLAEKLDTSRSRRQAWESPSHKRTSTPSWQQDGYNQVRQVLARQAEGGPPPAPVCPACGGIEWVKRPVARGDPDFGKMFPCPVCANGSRRRWIVANCGLEGTALDKRLSSHWTGGNWTGADAEERTQERRYAWQAISKAIKTRAGLFTFWGDFGSGKSHALEIIANECIDQLVEVVYAPMAGVLDHLRSMYGQKLETSDYWQRLLDVPALCLDEVTRINPSDWAREKLFVLTDTRYRRRDSHLTCFATNSDPRQHLPTGESIGYLYSRMREGVIVGLHGDMRAAVRGSK